MEILLMLLSAYGVAFLVQNKLPRMEEPPELLDKLLSCIYCLGFWSGLLVYVLSHAFEEASFIEHIGRSLVFGFASAVFSYVLDTAVQWFEENRPQ